MDFQDGQTQTINGVAYTRQGGVWHPQGAGPVYGAPRQAPMQTPDQAVGQSLQNQHTTQEIASQPLQNASTQANIRQSNASVGNQHFNQNQGLRQEFNNLPEVKNYSVALQSLGTALKAPDTPQGDLSIIYSYAKAADPGSVVREGEMDMATATASIPERYRANAAQLTQGKRLPPEVRTGLIETMRQSVAGLRQVYDQQRGRYGALAQQNGMPPEQIIGKPLYDAYRQSEENYIRSHGGTPNDPNATPLQVAPSQTKQGFDLKADPRNSDLTPEQATAYDAWWKANPNATPQQLKAFGSTMNLNIGNADAIVKAKRKSGKISHDLQYVPDISGQRGKGGVGEQIDAIVRGAVDTPTFGMADKLAAVGDTLTGNDTFGHNLAKQYAISDYDTQNHFPSRLAGQIAGGFAVPFGEANSIPQVALKSGAIGAGYGAGSSRSLSDVPVNALLGGTSGIALGGALGGVSKGVSALRGRAASEVPPLIDPQTGELNQPMDAMRPADRVQAMHDYGLSTVTPGMAGGRTARVMEQGFTNLPGSAGRMEDVNSSVAKELRRSMQGVAQQFGTSKTLNEGGSELQRGAKEWMTRFDGVTSKAYNAIPISPDAPTNLSNTKATLEQLAGKMESNPGLAEEIKDPTLLKYLNAINKDGLSWSDLKDFRTFVGNKIGQYRLSEDARTSDYRSLYGALSEDMRSSASAQGPHALHAFDRANTLYREGQQRIDQGLSRILGPNTQGRPELAAAAIQAMTKGGKSSGDLRTLAQVKAATVKSGAWDEIASTLIHLGGQPANSEGRAFQPQTFVNWYADMAEPARRMLFKPELRKSLDGFVSMTQQLGRIRGLNNTSNTASSMFGGGTALTAAASLMNPILGLKLGGTLLANYALGRAWTSAKFVNLITGYGRALATGNQNAVKSQMGRLAKLAATNPELRMPIQKLLASVANDNTGAISGAAAGGSDPNGNQQ